MAETYYVKPENSPVNDLTLNSGDAMFIANGGTANGTTVNSGGAATVNDGGSANNTTVNEGGTLHLIGGAATGVNVEKGGRLEVNKGATATGIAAAKGATLVFDVAADTHIAGTSDGAAFLIQNGIATGFVLETGVLIVSEGGKAVETVLNSAGFINVSQGGSADKAVINTSGELKVSSGGTATEATVKTGGKLTVESSGFCDDATIEMGGNLYVVSSGGTAAGTYIGAMGNLAVSKGGTAYGTTVGAGGFLTVGTKGIAEGADVNGFLNVLDGGTASNVTVNEGAVVYVQSKGTGSDVSVDYGGILEVLADGRLKGATVAQGGSATIHADVMASNVVVDGGKVTVMSDGWAYQSGVSSNTIVQNGGRLIVSGGGFVVGAAVSAGGHVTVESDATFSSATVVAADVTALDGACVSRLNLESGGILNVVSGGKAEHINVSAGGVLTGILREASELKFYGGTLDLNIAGVSPESEALVDNISFTAIMPVAEDYLCTLTVSDTQAEGAYKLIEGASGFDTSKAITVKDTSGTTLGTLTVNGGSTTIGGVKYTLAVTTGNELTVTIGETSEPDTTPPTVTNIKASTTEPTNQNVTVTADFNDNVGLKSKLYLIDGGAWQDYTAGGVVMTKSGTVYFKAVDTSDNESAMWGITVDNIDKVAPTITNITPSTTAPAASVTVTATFADDWELASRQYKIGDGAWTDYVDGVTVTENGTVYFKAVDIAGNEIEDEYTVTNIAAPGEPLNEPDDGWNDYLYDSKNKKWNTEGNIAKFTPNPVSGNCEILLDEPGTVDLEGMHNMFGNDTEGKTGNLDKGDVGKINVTTPAKLSFSVKSTADATFYIYEDGFDKKNNRAQLTVGKVSVKKGKAALLSDICLTTGENKYYAAMVAKNVKKPGPSAIYNVFVVDSTVFVDADGGWNNEATNGGVVDNPFTVKRGVKTVKLDNTAMIDGGDYNNFVGFSDEVDYAKLDLVTTTYLSFDVGTNGSTKFTLWKRDTNSGKLSKVGGVTTLKSKNGELAAKSTKAQLLEVSDKYEYFVSMESKDAGKGGSAYYNVDINTVSTRFFDSADGGANNWLFNKKDREYNSDDNLHENTLSASGDHSVILDDNEIGDTAFKNFVGFKDSADYAKVVLTAKGTLSFRITALADVSFELWRKDKDGKDRNILTSLQKKTDVKVKDYAVGASATTDELTLDAGDYYISVTAKSTKANEKGSAFYNVTAIFSSAEAGSLAMPETDALAGASLDSYLDSASDKLFGETGGSLLA